jgi:hypothetical protein
MMTIMTNNLEDVVMKMRTASLGAWKASLLEVDASLSGAFSRNDVSFVVFDVKSGEH